METLLIAIMVCLLLFAWYLRHKKRVHEVEQLESPKKQDSTAYYDLADLNKLFGIDSSIRIGANDMQTLKSEYESRTNVVQELKAPPTRTSYTYIRDKQGLQGLIDQILADCRAQKEFGQNVIGVDTENESVFSYKGYLCLVQVSTLSHDFVIDLLAINDNKFVADTFGQQVLANESIIKILHGCSNDIAWTLRDLGVRITNIFDTQDIFQKLGGTKLALNHLWEVFCNYKMDSKTKTKFQKSTWSKRPLSEEMIAYAATDSRYLIYLRHVLLTLALEEPNQKARAAYPHLRVKLSIRQLAKLYVKMQKSNVTESNCYHSWEDILKKLSKGESEHVSIETMVKFNQMYEHLHKYCLENDISPECMWDYTLIYALCVDSEQASADFELLIEEEKHEEITHHKEILKEELLKLARETPDEKALADPECLRILGKLHSKKNKDREAQLKEEKRKQAKLIKRNHIIEKYCVQHPIYENSMILAPDGEVLWKCDRKKIEWYLDRNLAVKISDDPLTIRLNFEPSGRGVTAFDGEKFDDEFYVEYRINQCVVCGREENYCRFQIIPSEYRMFFPEKYKAHRSHDVLLLCFDWNEIAAKKQAELKSKLSKEYNVPKKLLAKDAQSKEDVNFYQRRVRAIIQGKDKIPEDRINSMYLEFLEESNIVINEHILRSEDEKYLKEQIAIAKEDITNVNYTLLNDCLKLKARKTSTIPQKRQNIHGKVLIEKFGGEEKMSDFIKMWRQLFIDTMQPKFLPKNWSIDHWIIRKFGDNSIYNKGNQE